MFGNKELQTQVSELTELNTGLNSQIEELQAQVEELDNLKASNQELQNNMSVVNGQNTTLSERITELEVNQENIDSQVSDSALDLVASIGHEPVSELSENDQEIQMSVQEKYLSIKDPKEKFEFYKANKDQLLKAVK